MNPCILSAACKYADGIFMFLTRTSRNLGCLNDSKSGRRKCFNNQ